MASSSIGLPSNFAGAPEASTISRLTEATAVSAEPSDHGRRRTTRNGESTVPDVWSSPCSVTYCTVSPLPEAPPRERVNRKARAAPPATTIKSATSIGARAYQGVLEVEIARFISITLRVRLRVSRLDVVSPAQRNTRCEQHDRAEAKRREHHRTLA